MEEIKTKKCSKCGEEKPLTREYFAWRTDTKKFRGQCRKCCNKRHRVYNKKSTFTPNEKRCPCCGETKPSNDFLTNVARWDNLSVYCKECDYRNLRKGGRYYHFEKERSLIRNKELENVIRRTLLSSFKRKSWGKKTKTQNYLKCNWETFKEHIEKQFTDGMTWDNHGEWHYDHYYPVSLAQTEEDMFIFNHYTNFQPLWAKDNLQKHDKCPDGFEEWYEMMKEKVL